MYDTAKKDWVLNSKMFLSSTLSFSTKDNESLTIETRNVVYAEDGFILYREFFHRGSVHIALIDKADQKIEKTFLFNNRFRNYCGRADDYVAFQDKEGNYNILCWRTGYWVKQFTGFKKGLFFTTKTHGPLLVTYEGGSVKIFSMTNQSCILIIDEGWIIDCCRTLHGLHFFVNTGREIRIISYGLDLQRSIKGLEVPIFTGQQDLEIPISAIQQADQAPLERFGIVENVKQIIMDNSNRKIREEYRNSSNILKWVLFCFTLVLLCRLIVRIMVFINRKRYNKHGNIS